MFLIFSTQVKDHICRLVQNGVESGARLVLDGRSIVVFICYFLLVALHICYCFQILAILYECPNVNFSKMRMFKKL